MSPRQKTWIPHAVAWLACAAVMVAVWTLTLQGIDREWRKTEEAAQRTLVNTSRLTQEHASRTLHAADQALQLIRMTYTRRGNDLDLGSLVAQGAIDASVLLQVGVMDAQGIYRLSNLAQTPTVDLSDREHFKVHVAKDSGQIFISEPVLGRVAHKWAIPLTRRINRPDGSFGGVAVVSVDADYFIRFYSSLDLGVDGEATLLGRDGVVRARKSKNSPGMNPGVTTSPILKLMADGKTEGFYQDISAVDQVQRLHHYRQVSDFPLYVTVALGVDEYQAPYRAGRRDDLRDAALLSLLLLSLTSLFSWHRWREARNHLKVIHSEQRMNLALEAGNLALWDWDASSGKFIIDERLAAMLGYRASEFNSDNQQFLDRLHPDDRPLLEQTLLSVFKGTSPQLVLEHRLRHRDDHWVWLLARGKVSERDANGRVRRIVGTNVDISARKQTEEALRIAAVAFESSQAMVVSDVNRRILRVNQAFTEFSGYSAAEAIGQKATLLKSGRHEAGFYAPMWQGLNETGHWQGEIWNRRKSGEVFPDWLSISVVKDGCGNVTHYVSLHTDITQRKKLDEEIKRLAFYDALTHVPNRRLLLDRLQQVRAASTRSGYHGAALFLDLDRFKLLDDTQGHSLGDLLLQQVAQRLLACVRESDTVARIGGDEFVVMLAQLSKEQADAIGQARSVGKKILAAISQDYDLAGTPWQLTASIGVSVFVDGQLTAEEILKRADQAMYLAKAQGRNTVCVADHGIEPGADQGAVRQALTSAV